MEIEYIEQASPLGALLIAANGDKLYGVYFERQKHFKGLHGWRNNPENFLLQQAAAQLAQYFRAERREFDLPLDLSGTAFQTEVWRQLQQIPYGVTISYRELAQQIGKPKAVRAAAAANGRNRLSIIVPCHRVIGADGSLTGYASGIERKQYLLTLEQALPQQTLTQQTGLFDAAAQ